ncbi:MAG: ribonuclease HII [Thermoplasmatota archaeon]
MPRRATHEAARARREIGGPFAGVDEAGRGPVLGPLVVAGVRVDDEDSLRRLHVKDSKQLTSKAREDLYPKILARAHVAVRVLTHADLNRRMPTETLNEIEIAAFAEILEELGARTAFVDAADVVAERFGAHIVARLPTGCHVVSEHKADERYPCVSAASIVAKVVRDREIARIAAELGAEIGSGYSHDPATRAFLSSFVREHRRLPPYVRLRWETARQAMNLPLTEFFDPGASALHTEHHHTGVHESVGFNTAPNPAVAEADPLRTLLATAALVTPEAGAPAEDVDPTPLTHLPKAKNQGGRQHE